MSDAHDPRADGTSDGPGPVAPAPTADDAWVVEPSGGSHAPVVDPADAALIAEPVPPSGAAARGGADGAPPEGGDPDEAGGADSRSPDDAWLDRLVDEPILDPDAFGDGPVWVDPFPDDTDDLTDGSGAEPDDFDDYLGPTDIADL